LSCQDSPPVIYDRLNVVKYLEIIWIYKQCKFCPSNMNAIIRKVGDLTNNYILSDIFCMEELNSPIATKGCNLLTFHCYANVISENFMFGVYVMKREHCKENQ